MQKTKWIGKEKEKQTAEILSLIANKKILKKSVQ